MESDLKYPEWQGPLLDAIIRGQSFVEIETVIRERLRGLICEGEREALIDALATIRVLRQGA
jgi:hypothetical protein